jgi:hypothetical protein
MNDSEAIEALRPLHILKEAEFVAGLLARTDGQGLPVYSTSGSVIVHTCERLPNR